MSKLKIASEKAVAPGKVSSTSVFGVAYLIARLERSLARAIRTVITPLGITVSQYTALSVFNTSGQLSNAQLADRIMVSPQAANELIKAMEKKNWIERQPDPSHGRIIQIRLTEQGEKLLAECDAHIFELEKQMLDEFSLKERRNIKNQLRAMVKNLIEL